MSSFEWIFFTILAIIVTREHPCSTRKIDDPESRNFMLFKKGPINTLSQRSCNCDAMTSCACCETVKIFYTSQEKQLCFNMIYQRNGLNFDISINSMIIKSMTVANYKPFQMCTSVPRLPFTTICANIQELNQFARSITVCPRLEVLSKKEIWQIVYTCNSLSTQLPTMTTNTENPASMSSIMMTTTMPAVTTNTMPTPANQMISPSNIQQQQATIPQQTSNTANAPLIMMIPGIMPMPNAQTGDKLQIPMIMPNQMINNPQQMPMTMMMVPAIVPPMTNVSPDPRNNTLSKPSIVARAPLMEIKKPEAVAPTNSNSTRIDKHQSGMSAMVQVSGTATFTGQTSPSGNRTDHRQNEMSGIDKLINVSVVEKNLGNATTTTNRPRPDRTSNQTLITSSVEEKFSVTFSKPAIGNTTGNNAATMTNNDSTNKAPNKMTIARKLRDLRETKKEMSTVRIASQFDDKFSFGSRRAVRSDDFDKSLKSINNATIRGKRSYDIFDVLHRSNRCERAYRICVTKSKNLIVSRLGNFRNPHKNDNKCRFIKPQRIVFDSPVSGITCNDNVDDDNDVIEISSNPVIAPTIELGTEPIIDPITTTTTETTTTTTTTTTTSTTTNDPLGAIIIHDESSEGSDYYPQSNVHESSVIVQRPNVFPSRTPPLIALQVEDERTFVNKQTYNDTLIFKDG